MNGGARLNSEEAKNVEEAKTLAAKEEEAEAEAEGGSATKTSTVHAAGVEGDDQHRRDDDAGAGDTNTGAADRMSNSEARAIGHLGDDA